MGNLVLLLLLASQDARNAYVSTPQAVCVADAGCDAWYIPSGGGPAVLMRFKKGKRAPAASIPFGPGWDHDGAFDDLAALLFLPGTEPL